MQRICLSTSMEPCIFVNHLQKLKEISLVITVERSGCLAPLRHRSSFRACSLKILVYIRSGGNSVTVMVILNFDTMLVVLISVSSVKDEKFL